MDPEKVFKNLCEALCDCDKELAVECIEYLVEWIDKDGFIPKNLKEIIE